MKSAAPLGGKAHFIQLDPHALGSSSHGKSQKEVAKVFHQTIPEFAAAGPIIVLLDEVETLAADRQKMSLETNPIDAHRATDAALSGIDLCAANKEIRLLIATTNFPKAVDRALLSRADLIEEIGFPNAEIRKEIIADTLAQLARTWPKVGDLKSQIAAFVKASAGMDGRRLRKAIISSAASSNRDRQGSEQASTRAVLQDLKARRQR